MKMLSEAAEVPLSIVMQTEIAHTNIQTFSETIDEMVSELSVEPDTTKIPLTQEQKEYDPLNSASIIPWQSVNPPVSSPNAD